VAWSDKTRRGMATGTAQRSSDRRRPTTDER
jgi:hypothetical protein